MKTISTQMMLVVAALGLAAFGCDSGAVGDPCIPEDEYNPLFSGFSEEEVNVESRSFQCATRVCLVNQFRGRVSCPYGNQAGGAECNIPGTDGSNPEDVVQAPVQPQLTERREDSAVYCSCRCKNVDGKTDDGASYCECPSGFSCEKLMDDPGLGGAQLAGYYCVKEDEGGGPAGECALVEQNCPKKYDY